MRIFELLVSMLTASMHLAAIIACIIRKDPWGWMFAVLAFASLIWVYKSIIRLKEEI